ncbi:MAG: hypothetical protein LBL43_04355 [Treponema sp.]|jgi:hypothetical protein|nr:hypothetical protein [Treponema sp.]
MRGFKKGVILFCLAAFVFSESWAQTTTPAAPTTAATPTTPPQESTRFDTAEFPQWARDLRRGEIIAIGVFPFVLLLTAISVDTYRFQSHGWNRQYAPWPIKSAGAVERDKSENIRVISIAAAGAAAIALADYAIVRIKRYKRQKEMERLPSGTPIIIQKPLSEQAGDAEPSGGAASGAGENP